MKKGSDQLNFLFRCHVRFYQQKRPNPLFPSQRCRRKSFQALTESWKRSSSFQTALSPPPHKTGKKQAAATTRFSLSQRGHMGNNLAEQNHVTFHHSFSKKRCQRRGVYAFDEYLLLNFFRSKNSDNISAPVRPTLLLDFLWRVRTTRKRSLD